jgi:enamine deaminase RidA (YjgF/YER057c/UK114 family)
MAKREVYTSAIIGSDPETGQMPENVEEEVANLFHYMREIMELAGGTTDDIAHLSVSLTDREYKKVINVEWLKMFPNEDDRPARHSTVQKLREGLRVQIEMTAVL